MQHLTEILIGTAAFVIGVLAGLVFTMRSLATAGEKNSRIPELENRFAATQREHSDLKARNCRYR